ncbi:hypothetical protein H072_2917 [Dactylellina haptotyla CBS 200.50]|uniref:Uncharacterized protein n=1 Tax=Dactylellina haptotyla (strain CBS 200.50) TaxID=1284197 RepID=S8BU97_DACHA|nr:hypothetical protein H072_2917 [Dactylellina haptotyla CBS 200.50]
MVSEKDIAQAVLQAVDGLFPEIEEISSAELSPDNLPAILSLLQETIDGVKSEIKHIGESQQAEVTAWTKEARQLHTELSQDHDSLSEITQFESRGAVNDRVNDLGSQQTLLSDEIVFNEELVAILNDLKELQDVVSSSQAHASEGRLDEACEQFEVVGQLFDKLSGSDQILAVGLMKENIRSLKEGLIHDAEDCWTRLISSNLEDSSVTIQTSVTVRLGTITGEKLVNTIDKLGILKEKLDRLHYRITHSLIFPRLQPISGATYTFIVSTEQNRLQLRKRPSPDQTVGALYADLKIVFGFLSEKLGSSISRRLSKILTSAVLNQLMGSYLPECIPTDLDHFNEFDTILNETSAFEQYLDSTGWLEGNRGELRDWVSRAPRIWLNRRREEALDSLRKAFSTGLGKRHRVERIERVQQVDGVLEASKPIDTAEDNWDTNWDVEIEEDEPKPKAAPKSAHEKPKSDPKPQADEEDVSGWGFDDDIDLEDDTAGDSSKTGPGQASKDGDEDESADWGWGDDDADNKKEAQPSHQSNGKPKEKDVQDITLRETYSVTSIPQEVINIILRTVEEAEKLSQPQYSNLTISSSTSGLLTIPASVLNAYRALAGIFYRDDPSPAICIYNDCEWLEENLVELEKEVKSKSGPFGGFDLQTSIKSISSFGRRSYWKEMDNKRLIFTDLMDGAQGFENCTQYPMSENCDTAIMSVIDALQGIEMQWRDTLSRSALSQSLGSLLNTIIRKFISDVEDLGDISADASAKLSSYVTDIGRLESLFRMPDQPKDALPMTAVYCEQWLKFQYLGNILDSSMAEIMDLWRDGALVDFETDELMDLIRALFADGEKRSQVLDELRRAR